MMRNKWFYICMYYLGLAGAAWLFDEMDRLIKQRDTYQGFWKEMAFAIALAVIATCWVTYGFEYILRLCRRYIHLLPPRIAQRHMQYSPRRDPAIRSAIAPPFFLWMLLFGMGGTGSHLLSWWLAQDTVMLLMFLSMFWCGYRFGKTTGMVR